MTFNPAITLWLQPWAPKTDLSASPLTREVPCRLGFTAPIAINAFAQLLIVISLAVTACAPPGSNNVPEILLFNGTGTSPNGVKAVEAVLKEATTYAQALCIDCSPEVERETLRIVGLIGTPEEPAAVAASATAAIADDR